jgi:hypothetical protein
MKRPVGSDAYWRVRAMQAEVRVLEEKKRHVHVVRTTLGFVSRVTASTDALFAELAAELELGANVASERLKTTMEEIGRSVGLEGNPEDWELVTSSPEESYIRVREEDDREE